MSMFLGHLGLALIVGAFFLCTVMALARNSGSISREEEVERYRVRHPANSN
ncbi:hypothetical protein HFO32_10955 [Rhizobium leguminosarum]|uniref:hypothetical protein n=1 Tax=Rhizobium leguminosarum TaxID=384 RepID=UPI001C94F977|nr:hypothetical protein [Rhizobium leguminosarum]MBY5682676.1 hypothetical protein [Rhizobium leguminosarum]